MIRIHLPIKRVKNKLLYFGHVGDDIESYMYGMTRINHYEMSVFKVCLTNIGECIYMEHRTPFTDRRITSFFVDGILRETDQEVQ